MGFRARRRLYTSEIWLFHGMRMWLIGHGGAGIICSASFYLNTSAWPSTLEYTTSIVGGCSNSSKTFVRASQNWTCLGSAQCLIISITPWTALCMWQCTTKSHSKFIRRLGLMLLLRPGKRSLSAQRTGRGTLRSVWRIDEQGVPHSQAHRLNGTLVTPVIG